MIPLFISIPKHWQPFRQSATQQGLAWCHYALVIVISAQIKELFKCLLQKPHESLGNGYTLTTQEISTSYMSLSRTEWNVSTSW